MVGLVLDDCQDALQVRYRKTGTTIREGSKRQAVQGRESEAHSATQDTAQEAQNPKKASERNRAQAKTTKCAE